MVFMPRSWCFASPPTHPCPALKVASERAASQPCGEHLSDTATVHDHFCGAMCSLFIRIYSVLNALSQSHKTYMLELKNILGASVFQTWLGCIFLSSIETLLSLPLWAST